MDILKQLNETERVTIVCVLHDLNLASDYCTKLLLLDRGALSAAGTPEEVLTYRAIEEVYRTKVLVYPNPHTGKPYVMGIPKTWLPGTPVVK